MNVHKLCSICSNESQLGCYFQEPIPSVEQVSNSLPPLQDCVNYYGQDVNSSYTIEICDGDFTQGVIVRGSEYFVIKNAANPSSNFLRVRYVSRPVKDSK